MQRSLQTELNCAGAMLCPPMSYEDFCKTLLAQGVWPVSINPNGLTWYTAVTKAVVASECTYEGYLSQHTWRDDKNSGITHSEALEKAKHLFKK